MSTLPGQASKGEKTKSKYQSLDINNLYRVSRGENLEKQQQKSANVYVRHGMQSLGKVPSARRAPVNLPSLKAEHSGSDAAVPLVPPGAQGWGKQDSNTTQQPNTPTSHSPPQNSTAPSSNANQQNTQQISPHQAAIALPVTTTIPPHPHKQLTPTAQPVPADKLWSSVMTGQEVPQPPLYQSPQFQHEFPSLSAGDGVPTRTGSDAPQYPSGLSLRPQTEGSWTQGGQKSVGAQGAENSGSGRPGPAHQGSPPQLSVQVGQQQQPFPPQIRGVMPSFMCKGSNFQQGPGTGNQNPSTLPTSINGRGGRPLDNRPPRLAERDGEEVAPRPIIKEEELNRMDEIGKDMGWAESDEIDYNQKLAFSDEESERSTKRDTRRHQQQRGHRDERSESHDIDNQRQWSSSRSNTSRGRSSEEEDIWTQRRSQTDKEVEIAVQRAKQRKEEEEKRFSEERSQAAAKKLSELNERIQKRDRDNQEGIGTINPSTVPPKPINHVDIPLPDFQKDKERDNKDPPRERDNRSRTPNDTVEDKNQSVTQGSSFRQLTQIEGKNFPSRKHMKPSDREPRDNREQNGPSFSKHFKEDLPPRFLKHQRNNSNSNLQTHQQQSQQQQPHQQSSHQQQQQQQYHHQSFDNRWASNNQNNLKHQSNSSQNLVHSRSARQDSLEVEREEEQKEYRRQSSEDSFRSSYHSQDNTPKPVQEAAYQEEGRENRHQGHHEQQFNRREQEENTWHKEVEKMDNKKQDHSTRLSHEDWGEKREKMREENPDRYERDRQQRPDNRDIRSARHSRESEPREYMGSWSESAYEEKRRDHIREDRRAVPGPITKERIEADDMRNEKRNLTQLKRGQPVEVKSEIKKYEKEEEQKKEPQFISAWADSIPPPSEEIQNKVVVEEKKTVDTHKPVPKSSVEQPKKQEKSDEHNTNRNRPYGQKKGWGNVPNDYHTPRGQPWQRRPSSRGQKHGGRNTESYMTTDSDGSAEDHSVQQKLEAQKIETNDQKNSNPPRKAEKDDKIREIRQEKFVGEQKKQEKSDKRDSNYVPRGEPSRHGRGGGNFRSGRMGMGKRIDGYGPPPAKSPFGGHQEEREREKKVFSDEANSSENLTVVEDKTKQNQQALAAGIIGNRAEPAQSDDKSKSKSKPDSQKNKPKMGDKVCDATENSDEKNKDNRKMQGKMQGNRSTSNVNRGGRSSAPASRLGADRRYDSNRNDNTRQDTNRNENRNDTARSDTRHDTTRTDTRHEAPRTDNIWQNSNGSLKKDDKSNDHNAHTNVISDMAAKNRDGDQVEEKEEKTSINGDSEGFQEVKSKKTVKERQKSADDKAPKTIPKNDTVKEMVKPERERKNKISPATQMLTQQQIQSIPSLMATPVNPPPVLPQTKSQFDRSRQTKLPPRFAKQKLQKQAMQHQQQQHHGMCDMNDINKVSQNINVYGLKDTSVPPPPVPTCAWDKPLGPQLRNLEHDSMLAVSMEGVKGLETTHSPSHGISPSSDKMMNKVGSLQDKTLLDGATPPVNTIIFENTNYKSAPGARGARNDKPRSKLDESNIDNSVISGFNKPTMNELLQGKSDKSDPIQLPLFKEDTADMKLDFFSADLQFSDDKASKNFVSKSIHAITSGNNTVDSLDYKIASVKKVWETSEQEGEDNQINFVPSQLDSNVFSQGKDPSDDNHEGYSPSPNQTASTTTNVKPTQQVSGSGQAVLSSSGHQQHAGIIAPGLMGNPLSPPPIPPILGTGVGIGPQYTANQHIGYQTGLTGNTQFGISAIPSPPTVPLVYNSSQSQIQAAAAQSGLYGAFQLDQLSGQARSQFPQYTNYHGLGQTANSPYSTQNVYLPTAPPHPPPTAQAPPELYQNMNSYRLSAGAQFGQNQQLNNPTTVLISSTSNSLMSASVKPSSQQISAIGAYLCNLSLGTKAGGVGQAYQPQSQQGQQVFMAYDPSIQANYLASNAGVMQRGPVAPSQNNVVPALQPSSSYYSGSTGGQSGYFQQPGSSTMPSAQLAQHQSSYGLQGNVFGTHNQSHTNTGMPNYNSHYLTAPMQVAAALNVPQFRSGIPAAYMKSMGSQQVGDLTGRPQQLKSPSSQEVLSSVFNTGPQIPSPKSRQNSKHPPPQSSPTAQHKYNLYQGVGGQQNPNMQRYPTPIQRPVNFQQMQQNISVNQKHRGNPNNKAPNRYYGGQNHSMTGHNDKSDDRKMNDGSGLGSGNSVCTTKSNLGSNTGSAVSAPSDKVKDNIKEETAAKD
ncbi:no circadian temperature entrainment isoform X2 [Leptinotarsa decemlineata]|uniref:no circadian temperature entrainment isoform X2 n=1 Tax=Leptinotarsa decemlineata TaxID=7539 RepID=UPI000C2518EE|nr:protein PRRC2C-like isoform X2 [Leptinotarsa decemlineata]